MARSFVYWLSGVVGLLLLLEAICRVLPVSTSTNTGYTTDPVILTYPARHQWVMSTGWDLRNAQRLQANNLGYAAQHDFVRNPRAIALIGDSYVEASMLDLADRPAAQLERRLSARPVYAMGAPGTALLDYAERVRYASEQLGVQDFVLMMEGGDVRQSLCGSGNVNGPCLDPTTLAPKVETLPPPNTAKRLLRQSALAQYLVSQLKVTPQGLLTQLTLKPTPHTTQMAKPVANTTQADADQAQALRVVDAVTGLFFERIKPHVKGKLVIMLDTDRKAIFDGPMSPDPARQRFIDLAQAAGAVVVDAEPVFAAHAARSPLKLVVGPYDGHMNPLAIGLLTQAAAAAFNAPSTKIHAKCASSPYAACASSY